MRRSDPFRPGPPQVTSRVQSPHARPARRAHLGRINPVQRDKSAQARSCRAMSLRRAASFPTPSSLGDMPGPFEPLRRAVSLRALPGPAWPGPARATSQSRSCRFGATIHAGPSPCDDPCRPQPTPVRLPGSLRCNPPRLSISSPAAPRRAVSSPSDESGPLAPLQRDKPTHAGPLRPPVIPHLSVLSCIFCIFRCQFR